jgi:hypothetical protein
VSGVTAQVDAVGTHFYSTCNQKDTDATVFATIPGFASGVRYIRSQLATNPALANVPIWITENNVSADFATANSMSNCNPGESFVADTRGSSAFFAAWRPLMFSLVGKAGAEALYHWDFPFDPQYGEFNDQTGQPRLSYWVDYWLAHMFASPPEENLLAFKASDSTDLETLAVRNPDNSVVVMIANYAVAAPADNNGPGSPRVVSLDVGSLGTFTAGSEDQLQHLRDQWTHSGDDRSRVADTGYFEWVWSGLCEAAIAQRIRTSAVEQSKIDVLAAGACLALLCMPDLRKPRSDGYYQ